MHIRQILTRDSILASKNICEFSVGDGYRMVSTYSTGRWHLLPFVLGIRIMTKPRPTNRPIHDSETTSFLIITMDVKVQKIPPGKTL